MDLGYFTMPLHPPGSDLTQTLEDDLNQIETLDGLGYAEAWIGEHFTAAWENIPAPDLFIASALARTPNIKLGTGVTCMPNHSPFILAHRIAQLDHMAKGRVPVGRRVRRVSWRLRGFRLRSRGQRPSSHDPRRPGAGPEDLGRPPTRSLRARALEVHHSGARGRFRPPASHHALPEAPTRQSPSRAYLPTRTRWCWLESGAGFP